MNDRDLARTLESVVSDPETRAWTFDAVGPAGETIGYGESTGDERDYERICASVLIQFASSSDRPQQEFIKAVVQEYNRRKESGDSDTIDNTNGGDN